MGKPRIFLGSSGNPEKLLQALTRGLEDLAQVDLDDILSSWLCHTGLLVELAHEVDFAAFMFAQDVYYRHRTIRRWRYSTGLNALIANSN
ncbi:MAG TPA: hypothetical protein VFG11_10985 [Acidobacteriota bacterium]|nr:hypothetical protein [Acidobacteriota bacterium]